MSLSGLFERQELQTINQRFDARQWLSWNSKSLERLNPKTLWDYHERNEFPRVWYHWDWTLSWLVENNHPPVMNHIVIFNRTFEDEPPDDAIKQMPWMEPLAHYPLPRKTVAEMVDFLAANGARAIILDNDFPQHAEGDKELAEVVHKWNVGVNGRRVPIFMVETVNSGSDSHVVELGVPTKPVGVLAELSKLEPGTDVEQKYLGTTCVSQDMDQVVRGIYLKRYVAGTEYDSVILKLLERLGQKLPPDLPDGNMDIDFASPPKYDMYPTRPLSYLLDPEQKKMLASGTKSGDVSIKDAIVFMGDGVTDVYSTPLEPDRSNVMSGTEILAQALDTVSRRSWPRRLTLVSAPLETVAYLLAVSIFCGALWLLWKGFQVTTIARMKVRRASLIRLLEDLVVSVIMVGGVYLGPCLIFLWCGLLVPMFVPTIAISFGTLAAFILEREWEREEKFQVQLKAAEEKLTLTQDKYEAELKRHEAEAQAREVLIDKQRRHEFVRRINHDLNAPVSVLNWTVSELQMMELESQQAKDKVARLVKSSDKLCELIDQLVQSYDYETVPKETGSARSLCDLASVVHDCVDGQLPLATMHGDELQWSKPQQQMWVMANQLELTRVVDNIVRNAIKHNPQGTKVCVSVESNGRFHIVSIADNGKGIAPEHLEKIFQPGFRVDHNKEGHGLGLDIAKTLIEAIGGEISVTSAVRKGTTFKLKIPICKPPNTGESPPQSEEQAETEAQERIKEPV